jgi:hypothetical protein
VHAECKVPSYFLLNFQKERERIKEKEREEKKIRGREITGIKHEM